MKEKFFYCKHCGNIAILAADHGVTPVCCGEEMQVLEANTVDAAQEKHVPAVKRDGNHLEVVVGSTKHPMEEKHWIEFIAVAQEGRVQIARLHPGEEPQAEFDICDGPCVVYEHCNLHGLWQAEA